MSLGCYNFIVKCSSCGGILPAGKKTFCSWACQRQRPSARRTIACGHCGKQTTNKQFCGRSCAARVVNARNPKRKRILRKCVSCRRETYNARYCGLDDCVNPYSYEQYIARWLAGEETGSRSAQGEVSNFVRRWVRERDGNRCVRCGWCEVHPVTGLVPVQLNHIDGNFENNRPENLEMLCPNHHSLTPTFGALNKGNGRGARRARAESSFEVEHRAADVVPSMV
jgi:hypothetical protein